MKRPFTTKEKLEEISREIPTPFHIYDEKGIRENARLVKKAFSWNKGFREYFAVKAEPNPVILKILKEEGCGCDCSSLTELMMAKAIGNDGEMTMFSSNDTPPEEYVYAHDMNAIVNLDDFTMIDCYAQAVGSFPKKMCCRYNPGGVFKVSNGIMDTPGESKYGMTDEQLFKAFRILKKNGVEEFGIHSFLVSNAMTNDYYPMLAKLLFQLAVELHRDTGCHITFINLSGGVGIPYKPDDKANDILAIGEGVRRAYEEVLVPAGMGDVAIYTEMGIPVRHRFPRKIARTAISSGMGIPSPGRTWTARPFTSSSYSIQGRDGSYLFHNGGIRRPSAFLRIQERRRCQSGGLA